MQGPDYTQWHGIFELLKDMSDLKQMAADKLEVGAQGTAP
jgi:hypothetical protein